VLETLCPNRWVHVVWLAGVGGLTQKGEEISSAFRRSLQDVQRCCLRRGCRWLSSDPIYTRKEIIKRSVTIYATVALCFIRRWPFASRGVRFHRSAAQGQHYIMKSVSDNGRNPRHRLDGCFLSAAGACSAKRINFNLLDVSGDLRNRWITITLSGRSDGSAAVYQSLSKYRLKAG